MELVEGKRYRVMSYNEAVGIGFHAYEEDEQRFGDGEAWLHESEMHILGKVVNLESTLGLIKWYVYVADECNCKHIVPMRLITELNKVVDDENFDADDLTMLLEV